MDSTILFIASHLKIEGKLLFDEHLILIIETPLVALFVWIQMGLKTLTLIQVVV
jgi:hypothetical protein